MDYRLFEQIEGEMIGKDLKRKILQIIPAQPGWRVSYEEEPESPVIYYAPIVCWALCIDDDGDAYQKVVPMVVEDEVCIGFANFYIFKILSPGEEAIDPLEIAKREQKK